VKDRIEKILHRVSKGTIAGRAGYESTHERRLGSCRKRRQIKGTEIKVLVKRDGGEVKIGGQLYSGAIRKQKKPRGIDAEMLLPTKRECPDG